MNSLMNGRTGRPVTFSVIKSWADDTQTVVRAGLLRTEAETLRKETEAEHRSAGGFPCMVRVKMDPV